MKSAIMSMRQPGYSIYVLLVFLLMMAGGVSTASAVTVAVPASLTVPANDIDGNYAVSWGASPTDGATYVLQEALNNAFTNGLRDVYRGSLLTAPIWGRPPGLTYYYRVRARLSDGSVSGWKKATNGCLSGRPRCEPPSSITLVGDGADNAYRIEWGSSSTDNVDYFLQEATDSTFNKGVSNLYFGKLLDFTIATAERIPGLTYYYRVNTRKNNYPTSIWTTLAEGITIPKFDVPVAKTGQTYTEGVGDDGNRQKGVAFPSPRFTDNGNGTVTDNLTGLIWLKNANCFGTRLWVDALADANGLANGQCGLTDGSTAGTWRLPNARELSSLIHFQYVDPALSNTVGTGQWTEGNPFTGIPQVIESYYWSSSSYMDAAEGAWGVDIYDGYLASLFKVDVNYVWPVKGGQ